MANSFGNNFLGNCRGNFDLGDGEEIMKIKWTNQIIDDLIRDMAFKAVKSGKVFEYMLFWMKEPVGWQKKAKKYLQEAIRND